MKQKARLKTIQKAARNKADAGQPTDNPFMRMPAEALISKAMARAGEIQAKPAEEITEDDRYILQWAEKMNQRMEIIKAEQS